MSDVPLWVPIATAVFAATATLIGVFLKGEIDRRARIETESRERRYDVYRRLTEVLRGIDGDSEDSDVSRKALAIDLALFASDEVVQRWGAFLDAVFSGKLKRGSPQHEEHFGRLLLAMRRDASRPGTSLVDQDMLGTIGIRWGRDSEEASKLAKDWDLSDSARRKKKLDSVE